MISQVQSSSPLIDSWAQDCLRAMCVGLKIFAARMGDNEVAPSYWQLVFSQSRVNGCPYDIDELPQAHWQWPKETWFQVRLRRLRIIRDHA